MKFKNVETKLQLVENEYANYAKLLLFLYRQVSSEGLTLAQIKTDMKTMDILEENINTTEFDLPDESKESIKKIVNKSVWPIRHKDLVAFSEYIDSL